MDIRYLPDGSKVVFLGVVGNRSVVARLRRNGGTYGDTFVTDDDLYNSPEEITGGLHEEIRAAQEKLESVQEQIADAQKEMRDLERRNAEKLEWLKKQDLVLSSLAGLLESRKVPTHAVVLGNHCGDGWGIVDAPLRHYKKSGDNSERVLSCKLNWMGELQWEGYCGFTQGMFSPEAIYRKGIVPASSYEEAVEILRTAITREMATHPDAYPSQDMMYACTTHLPDLLPELNRRKGVHDAQRKAREIDRLTKQLAELQKEEVPTP